ncbi:MAG: hypothetical protein OXC26_10555 [Albidovulum sp.]|nr:hypothetical protein [Albidovulum sp.]
MFDESMECWLRYSKTPYEVNRKFSQFPDPAFYVVAMESAEFIDTPTYLLTGKFLSGTLERFRIAEVEKEATRKWP